MFDKQSVRTRVKRGSYAIVYMRKRSRIRIVTIVTLNERASSYSLWGHLTIDSPGIGFLECWIKDNRLARRPMYFMKVDDEVPKTDSERLALLPKVQANLRANLLSHDDSEVEHGRPELVYFSLCQNYSNEGDVETFHDQFWVAYWNRYPLPLKCYIASAFRLSKGEHSVRVDLVNSTNHQASNITNAKITSNSSCLTVPIHGDIIINVPNTGFYFVNAYIDGILTASTILIAETEKARFSYTLLPEYEKEVAGGQAYLLVKRSSQKKD